MTECDMLQAQFFLIYFPEAPTVNPIEIFNDISNQEDSTDNESLNGAHLSVSNLLVNTEAITSSNGVRLSKPTCSTINNQLAGKY